MSRLTLVTKIILCHTHPMSQVEQEARPRRLSAPQASPFFYLIIHC
jgi:hypothetical protein